MVWVLVAVVGALSLAVAALTLVVVRTRARMASLEARLASSDTSDRSSAPDLLPSVSLDADRPALEFLITRVGEADVEEPVRVDATLFADTLLRESVLQAASLAAGLRRALDPETRHRIRFHVRQEVKRSRKQRRAELRDVRREWAARQRAAAAAQDPAA